jgi:hypothetical protein
MEMLNFRKTLVAVGLVAMCATTAMAQWQAGASVTSVPDAVFIRQEGVTESLPPLTLLSGAYNLTGAATAGTYNFTVFINPVNGVQPQFTSANDATAGAAHEIVIKGTRALDTPVHCPVAANGLSFVCSAVAITPVLDAAGGTLYDAGFTISGIRVNATGLNGVASISSGITYTIYATVGTASIANYPSAFFAGSPIYTTGAQGYAVSSFSQAAPYFLPTELAAGAVTPTAPAGKLKVLPVCNTGDAVLTTDITADPMTLATAPKIIASINLAGSTGAFTTAATEATNEYLGASPFITNPTRIALTFSNIPTGVTAYVPWQAQSATGSLIVTYWKGLAADGSGAGSAATVATPYFAVTNGSTIFYQLTTVTAASGGAGTINIPLVVKIASGTIPAAVASAVTVGAQLAPISSASSVSIPRFAGTVQSQSGFFGTGLCSTSLLFPYVTTQPGSSPWLTGLAIANTSSDPFSTAGQSGTCSMYFYGADGTGAATTKNVSFGAATVAAGGDAFGSTTAIAAGTVATGLISSTNAFGTGTFSGYAVAVCSFQYAHGYSFVIGTNSKGAFSNGYLALVLTGTTNPALSRGSNNGQYEATSF